MQLESRRDESKKLYYAYIQYYGYYHFLMMSVTVATVDDVPAVSGVLFFTQQTLLLGTESAYGETHGQHQVTRPFQPFTMNPLKPSKKGPSWGRTTSLDTPPLL